MLQDISDIIFTWNTTFVIITHQLISWHTPVSLVSQDTTVYCTINQRTAAQYVTTTDWLLPKQTFQHNPGLVHWAFQNWLTSIKNYSNLGWLIATSQHSLIPTTNDQTLTLYQLKSANCSWLTSNKRLLTCAQLIHSTIHLWRHNSLKTLFNK